MQGLIKNYIKLNKYFTNIIKIAVVISDILEILYVFHVEKLIILIINKTHIKNTFKHKSMINDKNK